MPRKFGTSFTVQLQQPCLTQKQGFAVVVYPVSDCLYTISNVFDIGFYSSQVYGGNKSTH